MAMELKKLKVVYCGEEKHKTIFVATDKWTAQANWIAFQREGRDVLLMPTASVAYVLIDADSVEGL
jgi:hypothetical protein